MRMFRATKRYQLTTDSRSYRPAGLYQLCQIGLDGPGYVLSRKGTATENAPVMTDACRSMSSSNTGKYLSEYLNRS